MFSPVLSRVFCLVSATDDLSLLPGLAACGVDGFQVREKSAGTRELIELVRRVIDDVRPHGALVVVNDRLDVALTARADGVHLGSEDLPVAEARRVAPDLVVGATCRSPEEARRAADAGASYAGCGPLFATASKDSLPDPLGIDALAAATGHLPLVGIGGLDAGRARSARAVGAHGVAVIGSIWRHPDPLVAAKELVDAVA
ncbi:MAG: thiamine phosphate synthase [Nocardioides sp.]|nr:thiamine phosphate synthase [Nocardioides sp.]